MPEGQKALQLFVRNFSANILRDVELGAMSFEEAVYLLQEDLDNLWRDPCRYCADAGI